MIKHIVTMDADDFTTIDVKLRSIRAAMKNLPDTHWKSEINRHLSEIEDILGIDPPPIPEAVTARWSNTNYDPMTMKRRMRCSNCNHIEVLLDGGAPIICPNCEAVMTGVE